MDHIGISHRPLGIRIPHFEKTWSKVMNSVCFIITIVKESVMPLFFFFFSLPRESAWLVFLYFLKIIPQLQLHNKSREFLSSGLKMYIMVHHCIHLFSLYWWLYPSGCMQKSFWQVSIPKSKTLASLFVAFCMTL